MPLEDRTNNNTQDWVSLGRVAPELPNDENLHPQDIENSQQVRLQLQNLRRVIALLAPRFLLLQDEHIALRAQREGFGQVHVVGAGAEETLRLHEENERLKEELREANETLELVQHSAEDQRAEQRALRRGVEKQNKDLQKRVAELEGNLLAANKKLSDEAEFNTVMQGCIARQEQIDENRDNVMAEESRIVEEERRIAALAQEKIALLEQRLEGECTEKVQAEINFELQLGLMTADVIERDALSIRIQELELEQGQPPISNDNYHRVIDRLDDIRGKLVDAMAPERLHQEDNVRLLDMEKNHSANLQAQVYELRFQLDQINQEIEDELMDGTIDEEFKAERERELRESESGPTGIGDTQIEEANHE